MSKADPNKLLFGGEEAGISSFEVARVVVLPVPMEITVSYGSGTGEGPGAILTASEQLEFFDEETGHPYWSSGDVFTLDSLELPEDPADAVDVIAGVAGAAILAGKFLLTLGGEHTVTAGAMRAVARTHEGVGMVVVDAHLDLRTEYEGSRWSHACVMRRVLEEHFHAQPDSVRWCGARSYSAKEAHFVAKRNLVVIPAHTISDDDDAWVDKCIAGLPEKVYLSIDVDGLDPSVMPGTGTPEPGGLTYRQLLRLVRRLARSRTIVAADLVEVAPIPNQQVSEFTAARIAAKLVGSLLSSGHH